MLGEIRREGKGGKVWRRWKGGLRRRSKKRRREGKKGIEGRRDGGMKNVRIRRGK